MRALVLLHRWLGIGVCALFAMWFASGIAMLFVAFPSLTETERVAGLGEIDAPRVRHAVGEAVTASGIADTRRVRLVQRADGPVYVVTGLSRLAAVRADDLSDARVTSTEAARELAPGHAHRGAIKTAGITSQGIASHDQWTVPNGYDPHRPLYRIALNDPAGTELYVSSITGEIVQDTTRHERAWNYFGSVVHWIYPTILRSHWVAWDRTVWTLSLVALIAAMTGVTLGILRLRKTPTGLRTPFRGWHAWHHGLGLISATFVVTWIFSGWLSMDHGRLFSSGQMSDAERATLTPPLDMGRLTMAERPMLAGARELEWFGLGGQIYRRDRTGVDSQVISSPGSNNHVSGQARSFLTASDIAIAVMRIAPDCAAPIVVLADDSYPATSSIPSAPIYRSVCGDVWFHIDGANGAVVERLDSSRRAYRWAFNGLHKFDVPLFVDHPTPRRVMVVSLCLLGFVFSVTGVVVGWRRLRERFHP
ncbi:MAG: PepSY domain-containing protein [Pseudomonadota bacterium]